MKQIVVIFLLLSNTIFAQQISVASKVDKANVQIGDYVNYTLSVKYNSENNYIFWPNINENTFAPFTIIKTNNIDTFSKGNETELKQSFTVACYDSGLFVLPKLEIGIANKMTNTKTALFADSAMVMVNNVPVNINGDIKDIIEANVVTQISVRSIIIAIAILSFLIIAGIAFYLYKTKLKMPQSKNIYSDALQSLRTAEQKINNSKECNSIIAETIKVYLSKKYKVNLVEKTSVESLEIIASNINLKEFEQAFFEINKKADFVKFAKYEMTEEQNKNSIIEAKQLIDNAEAKFIRFQKEEQERNKISKNNPQKYITKA
jgi:hypothetical protein